MALAEKLPSYLVKEILCRLTTKSLARFRAVSKTWNAFWGDKSFLEKCLARTLPQFIVWTNYHICSVGIDDDDDGPRLELRDITLDISIQASLVHCDGFLLSSIWKKGFEVWNPCLRRRKRFVENHEFRFCGLGYDNSRPETTSYKIFGYDFYFDTSGQLYQNVAIYDCKSDAFKIISNAPCEQDLGVPQLDTIVCLNGNLYWIAYHSVARQYFIRSFDFSKEMFKTFCLLPHSQQQQQEDFGYTQVLAVFRGDRFSVLRRLWRGCVS
ncbi:PREDICTED: probable F-box protein At3g44130 [Camelina sativa]|uniref:Probable F-box protein At3g44130 n=1 Tax=Camelina sativa TaxID=90675 RepID=A0ABM0YXT7_CAMSA|nr:PREDICTED: probable F-box protein At3g44130 [Camelina sativa]